jgi:DNA polymerase III subunit gamma/tau
LGEHLRNLLMSVDPATVKLIETSDVIRAKYREQAQMVSLQLLIDALDIINKSDVTYRTSNNKRLSLEIPLIQICRLSGQMQMPVYTTTPAIQQVVVQGTDSAAVPPVVAQPAVPQVTAQAPPKTEPAIATPTVQAVVTSVPPVEPAAPKPETQAAVNTSQPAMQQAPVMPVNAPAPAEANKVPPTPEHDPPVQSHHVSSFSIKSVLKADQLANSIKQEVVKDRSEVFTLEQLETSLLKYAELKKDESALYYAALTTFKPELLAGNVLQVTVGNTVLEKELNDRRNILLEHLRDEMKNDSITLQVKVTEQVAENKKYMNDRDKLDAMGLQNPNVNKLRDQLNLDLDI